ncbi:MAG: type II toxin-antitoxin system MqsA family antitoxin [Deltaproteobacteria bacterium]
MRCLLCKGEMEKSTVSYVVNRKGYHIYVESIPAFVCSQCGERYFDEKEVDAIQDMIITFEEKLSNVARVA